MRITGGKYKGKHIQTPKGQGVRPTSSKVRESIFNIIQLSEAGTIFYEGETIMLDLFAGSGIMGMESLSRGSSEVIFVEKNPRHAEIIRQNLKNLENINTRIIISDALKALDRLNKSFNFIFIDPPYSSDLYEPVLQKIKQNNLLLENGFIILEYASSFHGNFNNYFNTYKTKTYGDTGIEILVN